ACRCGPCTISNVPSCSNVKLHSFYDNGSGNCELKGFDFDGTGQCTPTNTAFGAHSSLAVVTVDGGSCASPGAMTGDAVSSKQGQLCTPPTSRAAAAVGCDPLPSSLERCIAHDGELPCPPSTPKRTLVGRSARVSCTDCACSVSTTCPGATINYDDN